MKKYDLFYFTFWMIGSLLTLWVGLKMFSDFTPIRSAIEGKMGRFGITTNMTLEQACIAGLDGIDRNGRSQALSSQSTVEELLDKIIK